MEAENEAGLLQCIVQKKEKKKMEAENEEAGLVQCNVQKKKKRPKRNQREYVACLKCTHDCFYAAHAAAFSFSASKPFHTPAPAPSFLKVLDNPSSGFLEIPEGFVESCLNVCIGEAKLEGPSGWVWYAPFMHETSNRPSKVMLSSPGWDDFAQDHKLQMGDLLVLSYFSVCRLFKVRIFDALKGLEKSQHCLPSKPHYVSVSHSVINEEIISNMKLQGDNSKKNSFSLEDRKDTAKKRQDYKSELSLSHEFKNRNSRAGIKINTKSKAVKHSNFRRSHLQEGILGNIVQLKESENCVDGISRNAELMRSPVTICKIHENFYNHSEALVYPAKKRDEQTGEKNNSGCLQRSIIPRLIVYNPCATATIAEKERVEKEAQTFHSNYPFLVKCITASSIYKDKKLVWPKAFTNAYMPNKRTWMTWMDAEGSKWDCLWLPKKRGGRSLSFISAGWALFLKAHQLIQNDICIFELTNQKMMFFQVHVYKQGLF